MSTMNLKQNSDGTLTINNAADAVPDMVTGGPASPSATQPRFYVPRRAKVPLAAVDTGGGVLSFQNTFGHDVIVEKLTLDVTVVASAACSISAGVTSTNGTTSSANLIDTLDVHTATGTFDSITDKGANGKSRQKLPAGKWLTISVASGASAALVGNAYISYHPI